MFWIFVRIASLRQFYEGESISNQPIPFPMDRDSHDFHALFQYMFYAWVQNCTCIELFFNRQFYKGESISNQPIPFPMDRDGHDFHALFEYMFYTWVQNCTCIESFFNKILNVKHG